MQSLVLLPPQLSYLLIYWAQALLGLRGLAGRVLGISVPGFVALDPGGQFYTLEVPISRLQAPTLVFL